MAAVGAVSSMAGLKVQNLKVGGVRAPEFSRASRVVCSAGAPWEKVGRALVATGAGLLIATSANAATVKLGFDTGALVFEPDTLSIKSGESVTFVKNAGFPHNIVFGDNVPNGVDVDTINNEEYLNYTPKETYTVKLTVPGTYELYCQPHQGAGMKAVITVK